MKLTIDFEHPKSEWFIHPNTKLVSIGSCFSEEIGNRLLNDGFTILKNPLGVLFHPLPIARVLQKAIHADFSTNTTHHDDVFFSWDASGSIHAYSESQLVVQFEEQLKNLRNHLLEADVLMITFGTSIGYRHQELNRIVGNCHKQPSSDFIKEFSEIDEMIAVWSDTLQQLKAFNSNLRVIFTVSPTKHLRSGLIENTRSKARLIEVIHQLDANYFPSFEIVQDVLRDYRFYKEDGAHPNHLAVDEVYRVFGQTFFSEEAALFQKEIRHYFQLKNHRPLYAESNQAKRLEEQVQRLKTEIQQKYPWKLEW